MIDTIKELETQLAAAVDNRQRSDCHQLLAKVYKQAGDFEKALSHYEQFHTIKCNKLEQLVGEGAGKQQAEIIKRKQVEAEWESLLASEQEQRLLAETLQEVTLALTSQTNSAAVLDEILRQVQRLTPYNTANVMLLDNDILHTVRWQGYAAFGSEEFMSRLVQPLANFPLDSQVIRSRTPLIIHDTRQEPLWIVFDETAWISANMVIPICLHDNILGVLRLDSDTIGQFSDRDVERLTPMVNAAVIALENARLYDQVQQELSERTQTEAETLKRKHRVQLAVLGVVSSRP